MDDINYFIIVHHKIIFLCILISGKLYIVRIYFNIIVIHLNTINASKCLIICLKRGDVFLYQLPAIQRAGETISIRLLQVYRYM